MAVSPLSNVLSPAPDCHRAAGAGRSLSARKLNKDKARRKARDR